MSTTARPAGQHAEPVDQDLRGRREHHAGKVVVGEDGRLLDRARGHDDVASADAVERRAVRGRDQRAVEDAERSRAGEDVRTRGLGRGAKLPGRVLALLAQKAAAGLSFLFEHQRVETGARGLGGRGQARWTRADHQDIGMQRDPLARIVILCHAGPCRVPPSSG